MQHHIIAETGAGKAHSPFPYPSQGKPRSGDRTGLNKIVDPLGIVTEVISCPCT